MLKHGCLVLLLSLFFSSIALGQSKIVGKIVDSLQQGVPYAPVALVSSADSTIVKGAITDETGLYYFNSIRPGNYLIKAVVSGYKTQFSAAFYYDSLSVKENPSLELHTGTVDLNAISVTAVRSVVDFKGGNIIINVENSPLAIGNTVYDLLLHMPGVNIDSENNISIQGRKGVKILIDEHIQQLSNDQVINLLKSMSTSSIEKIEILKNPPVKYDASGTAGMINIVSKKIKIIGFSGNANASYSQGFYSKELAGVSVNYKSRKALYFIGINGNYGNSRANMDWNRNFNQDTLNSSLKQNSVTRELGLGFTGKAGADFFINSKNSIGFSLDGNTGTDTPYEHGTIQIENDSSQGFDNMYYSSVPADSWTSISYNLNAEHKFDTAGTSLSFSTDYNMYSENATGNYENLYFDSNGNEALPGYTYRNGNDVHVGIGSSKLDFKKTFRNDLKFDSGVKGSFIKQESNYTFENKDNSTLQFVLDTTYTNKFIYDEKNVSAYFNFEKEFDKMTVLLGLRGEYTLMDGYNQTNGFRFKRNYFQLFPNVSFDYSPSEKNNIQLSYNRRIDRPEVFNLNPFKWYSNQFTSGQGNPFLKPQLSNTIEFTYGYNSTIYNTLSYSIVNDYVLYLTLQNDVTKETVQSVQNIDNNTTYAYNLFIEKELVKWFSMSVNGSASYFYYHGVIQNKTFESSGFYFSAFANTAFILPANIKVEFSGDFSGPMVYGIGTTKSNWYCNFALKKSFLNDKLNIAVGLNDIFYSNKSRNQIKFENQDWKLVQTGDTRRIKLSISYNFGKTKLENRERNESDEEEKSRLKH